MQLSIIAIAVRYACMEVGREWRNRQAIASFTSGQKVEPPVL